MAGFPLDVWDDVAELIESALERPPGERAAYLRETLPGDDRRFDTAERVLRLVERSSGFLDLPVVDHVPDLLAEAVTEEVDRDDLPARVGPYRVVRRLGRGGMGDVVLAERDDGVFDRAVAIKRVRAGPGAAEMAIRFRWERRVLASLDHPNVARLVDGGVTDDGRPYFVMEYVEGIPIDEYCDRHALGIDARLDLVDAVLAAVAYAHRKLVVHRDLKPANILVDTGGQVKLLDFGLAKVLDPAEGDGTAQGDGAAEAAPFTRLGARVLTPEYASPEQFLGETVSTASDVFSLGVVVYELLTGRTPHRPEAGGLRALERAVVDSDPPRRPSAVASDGPDAPARAEARATTPARLTRRLKGDLDTILLTALAREPEARYASVDAMRDDLVRHRERRPIAARAPGLGYRAARFLRRHAVAAGLAAVAVLAVVGGVAATLWQARTATVEARRAERVSALVISMLEAADPDEALGEELTARALLDRASVRLEEELADEPETLATMAGILGTVYQQLGLFDQAEPHLERALQLHRSLGSAPSDVADGLTDLAALRYARGEYEAMDALLAEARAIYEREGGPDDPGIAAVDLDRAASLGDRGDYDAALPLYEQVAAFYESTGDSLSLAGALNGLGLVLMDMGDPRAAIPRLERAIALRRASLGELNTQVAVSLCNLAHARRAAGLYEASIEAFEECLGIRRRILDPDHPSIGLALNNLALVYVAIGDLDQAETMHREALDIQRRAFGEAHRLVAGSLNNLAVLAYRRGDLEGAAASFREVLEQWTTLVGEDHPNTITTLNNLGATLYTYGDLVAAEPVLREAISRRVRVLGDAHPQVAESRTNLANLLIRQERWDEAEREARSAVEILDAAFPDGHPTTATPLIGLGRIARAQGRCGDALAELERALRIRVERLGDEHASTADARLWLGRCLGDLGRTDEAVVTLEAARSALASELGESDPSVAEVDEALAAVGGGGT